MNALLPLVVAGLLVALVAGPGSAGGEASVDLSGRQSAARLDAALRRALADLVAMPGGPA